MIQQFIERYIFLHGLRTYRDLLWVISRRMLSMTHSCIVQGTKAKEEKKRRKQKNPPPPKKEKLPSQHAD